MKVLEIYIQKLRFKNYSERTIDTYSCYLRKFFEEQCIKDPYQVSIKTIKSYLINKKYSSCSQQNQVIGSLKLFAKYILGKKQVHLSKIERPKKEKKLPKVIDSDVLKNKILCIENKKHKAILALGFSCALRVSEIINLKICDIDSKRNIIHIRNSKGRKDRIVPVTENLLNTLRDYYKEYSPKEYLFNGQSSNRYTSSSCNKIMKKYIHEKSHFHLLRHSGATDLHERGTDIATLSKLLGHNSVKTTMIYTHVSNNSLRNIRQAI